jgi:hypothetical protein
VYSMSLAMFLQWGFLGILISCLDEVRVVQIVKNLYIGCQLN